MYATKKGGAAAPCARPIRSGKSCRAAVRCVLTGKRCKPRFSEGKENADLLAFFPVFAYVRRSFGGGKPGISQGRDCAALCDSQRLFSEAAQVFHRSGKAVKKQNGKALKPILLAAVSPKIEEKIMLPVACMLAETWISPDWAFPLTAVFSPLVHLCPVAGLPPDTAALRPLIEEGRLLSLSPALAEPLAGRLRDLAGVLSSGEAASHSAALRQMVEELLRPSADPESSRALVHELRDSGPLRERDPVPASDTLIRERILLLLTAQAKRDQEELAAGLAGIGRRQQAMFADMGDKVDNKIAEPNPAEVPAELPLAPVRAWLRLLVHTSLPCSNPWFITRDVALAAALLARYQQRACGTAITLPELFLSANSADSLPSALLQGLADLQETGTAEAACEAARVLARQIRDKAPVATPALGLPRLELQLLPGVSLPDLLTDLLAEDATTQQNRQDTGTFCLFGVLHNS